MPQIYNLSSSLFSLPIPLVFPFIIGFVKPSMFFKFSFLD